MSKAKHQIGIAKLVPPEIAASNLPKIVEAFQGTCSCGWKGPRRGDECSGSQERMDLTPLVIARMDGQQHAIEVVMAMPMLPDEYRSRFGTPE